VSTPNIIVIFADDMGYGDMSCNNPQGKIATPHLDRLASQGMRFTDAHAGTAVCTPSRYALLTGRYCWRSRLKNGIVWEYDGALIEPGRTTVASFLREQGYATHCIGKWHLGWDWPTHDGRHPNETLPYGVHGVTGFEGGRAAFGRTRIDYTQRIAGGPIDRGFDTYFGVDVPNFPPYTWFIDDRVDPLPTEEKPEGMFGHPGPAAPDWSLEAMIPQFTRRAVERIEAEARQPEQPFFLYFPLTSPHTPIVPNKPFIGSSGVDLYGDFVCEVDWVVGQVMDALQRTGQADNTLVIFTSDNGPERKIRGEGGMGGVWERAEKTGHFSNAPWRGIKRDAWEGGHRMPFVARWPQTIPAGSTCDQTISLVDLLATAAEIVGAPLPQANAGEDSVSALPLLKGATDRPTRDHTIYHSMRGTFAIRMDGWVLLDGIDTCDEPQWFRERIGVVPHDQPGELFCLTDDPMQTRNRYADQPQRVNAMRAKLRQVQGEDAPTAAAAGREPSA